MDLGTILGLILSLVIVVVVLIMDGGSPAELFEHPSAILLTLVGSAVATMMGNPLGVTISLPKYIMKAFMGKVPEMPEAIEMMVKMSDQARREGLLALEGQSKTIEDNFMRKGIMMVVDGIDPEQVRTVLTLEVEHMQERHHLGVGFFEQASGFSPTFGIIGTVMGLIAVLQQLDKPETLGKSIAAAFLATLWGLLSANLIWGPIGAKLKVKSDEEVAYRHMLIEGILGIQAGENPRLLKDKLSAFMPPNKRAEEGAAAGKEAKAQA